MDQHIEDLSDAELQGLPRPVLLFAGDSDLPAIGHLAALFRFVGGDVFGDTPGGLPGRGWRSCRARRTSPRRSGRSCCCASSRASSTRTGSRPPEVTSVAVLGGHRQATAGGRLSADAAPPIAGRVLRPTPGRPPTAAA